MIRSYLDMLTVGEEAGLLEFRTKRPGELMAREFVPARDHAAAIRVIDRLAGTGDLYVGVATRVRMEPQSGGADAVVRSNVIWVDCDTPESVQRVREFAPLPACVVRSGSGGVHGYWPLVDPAPIGEVVAANRRLALAIGADTKATDAARILRVPGSLNWKHAPPRPVTIARFEIQTFAIAEVVGSLPPVEVKPKVATPRVLSDDLERVPPIDYFAVLCASEPDREGVVRCPLPDHHDRTPSCRVYADPADGWFCFGCNRGGTIYDLAAGLWGLETRGEQFKELRRRLSSELGVAA